MNIELQAAPPPLRQDASGTIRVGGTRVLLELVIRAFQDGATPEAIVQRYDTLTLRDVYAAITYYLQHSTDVEAYLAERDARANEVQTKIEAGQNGLAEVRARIRARRNGQG